MSLDCITLGAAPIFNRNITAEIKNCLSARESPKNGIFLALITEGDPCPRLDLPYAAFLSQALSQIRPHDSAEVIVPEGPSPHVPPIAIHTVGDLVMFRGGNNRGEGNIRTYIIDEAMLAEAAFTNLCVHFMFPHLNRIELAPYLRLVTDEEIARLQEARRRRRRSRWDGST
jgi:hypothetical protein